MPYISNSGLWTLSFQYSLRRDICLKSMYPESGIRYFLFFAILNEVIFESEFMK